MFICLFTNSGEAKMAVNNKMLKAAKLFDAVSACWLKSRYNFSTASALYDRVGNWRIRHGLPATGKEYGPMRDLPDWSFADGRPAPLPVAMKKRIKLNKEYCEKIIKLTKEVDECFELNKAKADMEEKKREHAIQNRLKSKGKAFT